LSHDEIGDLGICALVTELDVLNINLEEINLSGNAIGMNYTYFGKYADTLIHYFSSSSRMHTIKLSHNNLRGSNNGQVDKLLRSFSELAFLKTLDLSNNLLGQNYGP